MHHGGRTPCRDTPTLRRSDASSNEGATVSSECCSECSVDIFIYVYDEFLSYANLVCPHFRLLEARQRAMGASCSNATPTERESQLIRAARQWHDHRAVVEGQRIQLKMREIEANGNPPQNLSTEPDDAAVVIKALHLLRRRQRIIRDGFDQSASSSSLSAGINASNPPSHHSSIRLARVQSSFRRPNTPSVSKNVQFSRDVLTKDLHASRARALETAFGRGRPSPQ